MQDDETERLVLPYNARVGAAVTLILPFYPFVLWPCIKFYPLLTISSSRHLPLSNLNAPTHTKIPSARFHITIPLRTCQSLGHAFQTEISDVLRRRKYILNALE